MDGSVKVIYRSDDDMDHMLLYKNQCLLSDECEGFPRLTALEVLECLAKYGVITLEKETIEDA